MKDHLQKIEDLKAVVGIVGLGYVGLPLAATCAEAGFAVVGFDTDGAKIDTLSRGNSYIRHVDAGRLKPLLGQDASGPQPGRFLPTRDESMLSLCDAILICVPTPLTANREPDLSYVVRTAETIAKYLRPGQLIVLESTTYPGTTDEIVLPILSAGALEVGQDFFLAFSPEREDPNNPNFTTRTIPKLVGGVTSQCGKLATALYSRIVDRVIPVSSASVAEAAKLLENIYRCVNIALVNELKILFDRMGLDIFEVINAAATKPFGFTPFYPGPGLGGHCIPIDPFYLTWRARQFELTTRFIELAGEINQQMPAFVIEKLAVALNDRVQSINKARILILGVAYKRDIDDTRESPSLRIMELLERRGAIISYHDPYVPSLKRSRRYDFQLASVDLTDEVLKHADAIIIATDHSAFDYERIVTHGQIVIDTRNATQFVKGDRRNVIRA